jgi:hypothetical protein
LKKRCTIWSAFGFGEVVDVDGDGDKGGEFEGACATEDGNIILVARDEGEFMSSMSDISRVEVLTVMKCVTPEPKLLIERERG